MSRLRTLAFLPGGNVRLLVRKKDAQKCKPLCQGSDRHGIGVKGEFEGAFGKGGQLFQAMGILLPDHVIVQGMGIDVGEERRDY